MDLFFSFATDSQKELEGAWFDVPGGEARIKVARSTTPAFNEAVVKSYERFAKAPKTATSKEQQDAEYQRLMADYLLLDWTGFKWKGMDFPYSAANARQALAVRDFRIFVQQCADSFDAFRVAAEEEVGNA